MKRILFLGVVLIMLTSGFTTPFLNSTIYLPLVGTDSSINASAVAAGPQTYTVLVGWDNGQQGAMLMSYFPSVLTVHTGDTVKWVLNSMEIHTVTFLDGNPMPDFIVPAPQNPVGPVMLNPQAFLPTVPPGGMYDGTTYANSGLMQPSGNPNQPTTFSLTFTRPGSYDYVCLVHGMMMSGKIVVVDPSTSILTPAQVNGRAHVEIASFMPKIAAAITTAFKTEVAPVKNPNGTTKFTVLVGYSAGQVDLMGFFPNKLVTHPGDTVEWKLSPTNDAPHTVTFLNGNPEPPTFIPVPQTNQPPLIVINGAILGPINAGKTLNKTDIFHSGFMDPTNPVMTPQNFTIKIGTATGTYNYFCMLHDTSGMLGSLKVVLP